MGLKCYHVTEPSINTKNPASRQYDLLQPFRNGQRTTTQDGGEMGNNWDSFYVGPNPESRFHIADTAGQHSDSASGTFSWSQLSISQPSHAISYTSCLEENENHSSNFQNSLSVQQDLFCLPETKAAEHPGGKFNCSEYPQVPNVRRSDFKPPEKEIVCFGMVGTSQA